MAITLTEKPDSREWTAGDNPTCRRTFILEGTTDDAAAKDFLEASVKQTWNYLKRMECTLEPIHIDEATGVGIWDCTARYAKIVRETQEVGESSFSFDTGGGTQHVTQALGTVGTYVATGTAPDFKGAIGVTSDSVDGVDITVPVYNFSETHIIDDEDVDGAYKATLFNLTGKVNNASFRGFAAGEVLFLGASGSKRGADDWEISFRFAASPNMTNIAVGDITVPAKAGWEYLWVQYADVEDTSANRLVKRPVAATVNVVYNTADFAELGI